MLGVNYISAKFKQYRKQNVNRLEYRIPWSYFVAPEEDDGIVFLKTNALMKCYKFSCPDLDSSDDDTINLVSLYFNSCIRQLTGDWGIHVETIRHYCNDYPGTNWDNQLGYLIDARRKDIFSHTNHFKNEFYLTLTQAIKGDVTSKVDSLLYVKDKSEKDEGYYNIYNFMREYSAFKSSCEEILSYISTRIPIYPLTNDETVTYLHSSVSMSFSPRKAPEQPVLFDAFICDEDIETGKCLKIGKYFAPVITIKDFPSSTYPAMFDLLNSADIEYRWSTRWIGMEKRESEKLLEKYQDRFYGQRKSAKTMLGELAMGTESGKENPAAIQMEMDVNEAQVELANDEVSFGYYTACFQVWDEDYEVAMTKASYIRQLVNSCRFGAKIETSNSFHAWLGMMPGNVYDNIRKYLISSGNSSHLFPLSSVWQGIMNNKFTTDTFNISAPLLYCSTPNGVPFFLNLNIGDVFHSFIFGPTGAGKSTFLCTLESQFLKYPGSRVIVLDKDKTARGVTIASGGAYVEPGSDNVAFQPLRDLDTREDIMWAVEFIQQCLLEQGIKSDAEMSEDIKVALEQLANTKPPQGRDITSFQQYCQNPTVKIGIQPYTLTGQYGSIFDAKETKIADARFVMIELGTLMNMGEAAVTPGLMYIFKFIERHFAEPNDSKGHMTMLVMDEAWAYLNNEYFEQTINDWLKTLRKRHVCVIFATQNVSDAAKCKISDTIVSQCLTKFYLADQSANTDSIKQAYKRFGLTDSEIYALSQATMKKHYFYKSPLGARMFQLELDKFQLALLCPDSRVLDEIERDFGLNSGIQLAAEILHRQGIDTSRYIS